MFHDVSPIQRDCRMAMRRNSNVSQNAAEAFWIEDDGGANVAI